MTSIVSTESTSVRRLRVAKGLTQSELAKRAGISRQALGAIESAAYQPNVSVAIALARELGETVEAIFGTVDQPPHQVHATWDGAAVPLKGIGVRVALGRVAGKLVAHPRAAVQLSISSAAGVVERAGRNGVEISSFRSSEEIDATLLLAGCDPAATLLTEWMARHRSPVTAVALGCSSGKALDALNDGRAHVAGVHLRDPKSGDFNSSAVRRGLKRRSAVLVNFARWELGFATAAGNPLKITGIADLERSRLRIANRELGSGARATLDEAIAKIGIRSDRIAGYPREFPGHLEVAEAIASKHADFGITIRVAANVFDLNFIPIREERYDLVILKRDFFSAGVKAMLEALKTSSFAREVAQLCAYDTSQMGTVIANLN
jgi:molybdate-binding protein/DNA-binding XRE family transcriptional regulator